MKYAQIKDGLLKNIILLTQEEFDTSADKFTEGFDQLIDISNVDPAPGPGWSYVNSVFSAPTPVVPLSVSQLQLRRALRKSGLLSSVTAAVTAAGEEVLEAWDYADHFSRTDELLNQMAAVLALTSEQVDALFIAAKSE